MRIIKAFDQEWLVFRDSNNRVGVVSRYCCHMGADLSNGRLVKGCIECPLHGWKFNSQGKCESLPALKTDNDHLLADKQLFSLTSQEFYGLIFVFYGDEPGFTIPLPPNMNEIIVGNSNKFSLSTEFHAPCLNTFDIQHYRRIHHRQLVDTPHIDSVHPYHLGIKMQVEVVPINFLDKVMKWLIRGNATISIDCWGASILLMNNNKTGYGAVIAMLPIERYKSSMYIIPVKSKSNHQNIISRIKDRLSLAIASKMIHEFLRPDYLVLSGMKPIEGQLVEKLDDVAQQYWQYLNALPRYSHKEMIDANN